MLCEVRTYQVREGAMDEFVALWRDHLVPLREKYGYSVTGAWRSPDDRTFTWVVCHEAPDGWDAAEKIYYDAPERAALPREPKDFLEGAQTMVMRPV
jgi:NIPSNAP